MTPPDGVPPLSDRIVILGVNGGLGVALSRLLTDAGAEIVGVDLGAHAREAARCGSYLSADARVPTADLVGVIAGAGRLVVFLHEDVAIEVLRMLVGSLPAEALVVDTLSVKTPIAEEVAPMMWALDRARKAPLPLGGVGLRPASRQDSIEPRTNL